MSEESQSGVLRSTESSISGTGLPPVIHQVNGIRLISLISSSSAEADVWLGECADGGRVAVKIYRHGQIPGLLDVRKKCSLAHAGLVPVRDAGQFEDRYYEVSPFIEGPTLNRLVGQQGPFHESEVAEILRQLADAIHYLHTQQVLHRDIKPSNVFVISRQPLAVCLADFGSARLTANQTILTSTIGTVAYSAPEAVTGLQSEASDYWSLGMVLLEAVTGRPPFQGIDLRQQLYRVASGQVEIPEGLSPRLQNLFHGLLTLDYTRRWRKKEIDAWLKGEAAPHTPPVARLGVPGAHFSAQERVVLQRLPELEKVDFEDFLELLRNGVRQGLGRYFWLAFVLTGATHNGNLGLVALLIITLLGIGLSFRPAEIKRYRREKRVNRQLATFSRTKQRRVRRMVREWFRQERRNRWPRLRD
jgi:serine/threonine protein kinase